MKLLSIHIARAMRLLHYTDLNPKGKAIFPAIHSFLGDWYKLQFNEGEKGKGWLYEKGEFVTEEGTTISVSLHIASDVIFADTSSSTKDSENFLTDFMTRFSDTFDLPRYEEVVREQAYLSQIYLTPDVSLDVVNPKLKEISDYLSSEVRGGGFEFKIGSLSFWADQTNKLNPANFTLERALNVPFSENRYFSSAPLETDKHIALIERLEKILKNESKPKSK
jgi:hypothetical protein